MSQTNFFFFLVKKYEQSFILSSILFVFVCICLYVSPTSPGALNDDWTYSNTLFEFMESNKINTSQWQTIPALPQQIIGYFSCRIFGKNYNVLQYTNILWACLCAMFFFKICTQYVTKTNDVVLLTCLFIFNPLFLSLSNTYMPDISSLALTIICLHFMLKKHPQNLLNILFLTMFCILAILQKQSNFYLPVSFFIYSLLSKKFFSSKLVFIPLFTSLIVYFLLHQNIFSFVPQNFNYQQTQLLQDIRQNFLKTIVKAGYYSINTITTLGILTLPISIFLFKKNKISKLDYLILLIACITFLGKCIYTGKYFPATGNIFYSKGIGPILLTSYSSHLILPDTPALKIFWTCIGILGILSFWTSYIHLKKTVVNFKKTSVFIIIAIIMYASPILCIYMNDRYVIVIYSLMLIWYTQNPIKTSNKILFSIVLYVIISISLVKEYFNIHQSKNEIVKELTNNAIPFKEIDAGFENYMTHFFNFDEYLSLSYKENWWHKNQTYVISLNPNIPNYQPIKNQKMYGFLFRKKHIYLHKRN